MFFQDFFGYMEYIDFEPETKSDKPKVKYEEPSPQGRVQCQLGKKSPVDLKLSRARQATEKRASNNEKIRDR